jgi:hypothetical protein
MSYIFGTAQRKQNVPYLILFFFAGELPPPEAAGREDKWN